jgi:hypothetical protein
MGLRGTQLAGSISYTLVSNKALFIEKGPLILLAFLISLSSCSNVSISSFFHLAPLLVVAPMPLVDALIFTDFLLFYGHSSIS